MRYNDIHPGRIRLDFGTLAVVLFYSYDVFYLIINRITRNSIVSDILCLTMTYSILLLALIKRPKRFKADAVVILLLSALLFIGTCLFVPEYRYAILKLPTWNALNSVFSFSGGMAAYLFFRMIDNERDLRKVMRWSAYLLALWCLMRIWSSLQNGGFSRAMENGMLSKASYDMQMGYRSMYVSAVFGLEMLKNRSWRRCFFGCMTVAFAAAVFVFGSRTAVASLVVFWVLYALFCRNKKNKWKEIALLIFATVCVFILTNTSVLVWMGEQMQKQGLNSRMLNTLLQGEVVLDKGRTRMWNASVEMIVKNPVLGSGIFADRAQFGIYCHQIILEILLNYGCILGVLLLGGIAFLCLKSLLQKEYEYREAFTVFFSMWIIRLMMSSSYWVNTEFWISLALAVNLLERNKNRKKSLRFALFGNH